MDLNSKNSIYEETVAFKFETEVAERMDYDYTPFDEIIDKVQVNLPYDSSTLKRQTKRAQESFWEMGHYKKVNDLLPSNDVYNRLQSHFVDPYYIDAYYDFGWPYWWL